MNVRNLLTRYLVNRANTFFMWYDKHNLLVWSYIFKIRIVKVEVFEVRPSIYASMYTDLGEEHDDEHFDVNNIDIYMSIEPAVDAVKSGIFLLVEFETEKKKNAKKYRYAAIAQSTVKEDDDVKIM